MTRIEFWFDAISPYAWLAFDRLPQALEGVDHEVRYQPLVFGAVLGHWGQLGPAEIAPKRAWTYRQVDWLARVQGTPLQRPDPHPFRSLALQRLALACAPAGGTPNRQQVEAVLRHAWVRGGAAADDPAALAELTQRLAPRRDPFGDEVKAELRERTEAAIKAGVFGVPTLVAQGRAFFGLDSLPMLAAMLRGDPSFDAAAWDDAGAAPRGLQRRAGGQGRQ